MGADWVWVIAGADGAECDECGDGIAEGESYRYIGGSTLWSPSIYCAACACQYGSGIAESVARERGAV